VACAGTFLLAEAGILDGLRATTTWWLSPVFRSRYPTVQLDESRMVVASHGITTAGAAFGHVDLALAVVRTSSPTVADLVARYLVIEERPSQSVYAIPAPWHRATPPSRPSNAGSANVSASRSASPKPPRLLA
jgi:transcriptional regulator GlxA family with amidase domain